MIPSGDGAVATEPIMSAEDPYRFGQQGAVLKISNSRLVEAAGVERFFHSLNSVTYVFSIAYKTAKRSKIPLSRYSFGTVIFAQFSVQSSIMRTPAGCPPPPVAIEPRGINEQSRQCWTTAEHPPASAFAVNPFD